MSRADEVLDAVEGIALGLAEVAEVLIRSSRREDARQEINADKQKLIHGQSHSKEVRQSSIK